MQRIKMLQSVNVPLVGLYMEGKTYLLQEEITQILLSRNLAVPVEEVKSSEAENRKVIKK